MGEVKETVTKRADTPLQGGLLETTEMLRDELSRCIKIKEDDVFDEHEADATENIRKAALLRAAHALVVSVAILLEDYTNELPGQE